MANRRNLKRDIKYLTSEVIEECYTFNILFPKTEPGKVSEIITEVLTMHDELIYKINNPELGDDKKVVKSFYKNVFKELITSVDSMFEKLNKLAPVQ